MTDGGSGIGEFYDELGGQYDSAILRCVPRYREMQWAILRYVRKGLSPTNILELGCGSGNLTELTLQRYPEARIHCVDISAEMIEQCRRRFQSKRLTFHHQEFRDMQFASGEFDLVTSSISIHHVDHDDKKAMFKKVHEFLAPGGAFAYADQFAGASDEIYRKHIDCWREEALALGTSLEEWSAWMAHQDQHDHHAAISDQFRWLTEAGFRMVDCTWRYLLWTVIHAEK